MKAVVAAERFKSSDYAAMLEAIDAPKLERMTKISGTARPGWIAFDDVSGLACVTDLGRVREIAASLGPCQAVNIQFTSGTTGLPKGATLSHRNILNNAWFVGRAQQQIRAFCQGRIAHYKIPRYVRFVEEFPLTVSGKVQKFVIREQMIRELGLSVESTA